MRRFLRWLLTPVWRLLVRVAPDGDPWERLGTAPGLAMYGPGARFDFSHYLGGPSGVSVASLDDIQDWLLECRYERDDVLFVEPDFWQHPSTFERLRIGDCEDFALWAWRKMVELKLDADFVTGYCVRGGEPSGRHAWILFRRDGVEYLFEPGYRSKERMIRPLAEVRDDYIPQVGVDRTGRRFAFAGFLLAEKRRLTKGPARRTA